MMLGALLTAKIIGETDPRIPGLHFAIHGLHPKHCATPTSRLNEKRTSEEKSFFIGNDLHFIFRGPLFQPLIFAQNLPAAKENDEPPDPENDKRPNEDERDGGWYAHRRSSPEISLPSPRIDRSPHSSKHTPCFVLRRNNWPSLNARLAQTLPSMTFAVASSRNSAGVGSITRS